MNASDRLRALIEQYRHKENMRDEYLSQYRDETGDVYPDLLTEYDEKRADNNEDAAEDLGNLLDELWKLWKAMNYPRGEQS